MSSFATTPSLRATADAPTRRPLFDAATASHALDVAERLYAAALPDIARGPGFPESISRYGGATIVAEALARAGREDRVREPLREALVFAPDRLSLYDGAAGLLVALDTVDPHHATLGSVRAKLCDTLAASLRDLPPGDPATSRSYELITGPAGRAIALARASGEPVPAFAPFAHRLADAIERALERTGADAHEDDGGDEVLVNLGVSHGIAGVLAALNVALPEDRALARRYTELLLRCAHRVDGAHRWGAVWRPEERPTARRAWCYQTIGIAAVLADRARIDGDAALHALAEHAVAALLDSDESQAIPIPWDAALCHGRAGVAAIAWSFAGDAALVRHAERLAREILDEFDPHRPFGYALASFGEGPQDRTAFLDGALGVAQFLIDAATAQERRWLPLFGLAPD
ncbi:MAG TPA: lanthionine synthetase LanC family protein [Candidatus Elarobacter sp.]|nr:lanthionine synthetase LanC family protein [Candidatus Elarobacter sp.]